MLKKIETITINRRMHRFEGDSLAARPTSLLFGDATLFIEDGDGQLGRRKNGQVYWLRFWFWFRTTLPITAPLIFILTFLFPYFLFDNTDGYIFVGSILSLVFCALALLSYIHIKPWRRHPSFLIIMICFMNSIFSSILIYNSAPRHGVGEVNDGTDVSTSSDARDHVPSCVIMSFFIQLTLLAREGWILTLSVDLLTSITNPFSSYKTNLRQYHLYIWFFTTITAITLVSQSSCQGEFLTNGTCWIKIRDPRSLCFWGYFMMWVILFYINAGAVLTYAFSRISKGLESTYATRYACVADTFRVVFLFFLYGLMIAIFFVVLYYAANDNHDRRSQRVYFLEHCFAYLIACRGYVDALIWFFSHGFVSGNGVVTNLSVRSANETAQRRKSRLKSAASASAALTNSSPIKSTNLIPFAADTNDRTAKNPLQATEDEDEDEDANNSSGNEDDRSISNDRGTKRRHLLTLGDIFMPKKTLWNQIMGIFENLTHATKQSQESLDDLLDEEEKRRVSDDLHQQLQKSRGKHSHLRSGARELSEALLQDYEETVGGDNAGKRNHQNGKAFHTGPRNDDEDEETKDHYHTSHRISTVTTTTKTNNTRGSEIDVSPQLNLALREEVLQLVTQGIDESIQRMMNRDESLRQALRAIGVEVVEEHDYLQEDYDEEDEEEGEEDDEGDEDAEESKEGRDDVSEQMTDDADPEAALSQQLSYSSGSYASSSHSNSTASASVHSFHTTSSLPSVLSYHPPRNGPVKTIQQAQRRRNPSKSIARGSKGSRSSKHSRNSQNQDTEANLGFDLRGVEAGDGSGKIRKSSTPDVALQQAANVNTLHSASQTFPLSGSTSRPQSSPLSKLTSPSGKHPNHQSSYSYSFRPFPNNNQGNSSHNIAYALNATGGNNANSNVAANTASNAVSSTPANNGGRYEGSVLHNLMSIMGGHYLPGEYGFDNVDAAPSTGATIGNSASHLHHSSLSSSLSYRPSHSHNHSYSQSAYHSHSLSLRTSYLPPQVSASPGIRPTQQHSPLLHAAAGTAPLTHNQLTQQQQQEMSGQSVEFLQSALSSSSTASSVAGDHKSNRALRRMKLQILEQHRPPAEVVYYLDNNRHRFRDFRPATFRQLRAIAGISEEDYRRFIRQPTQERLSEGRSGAFFFICGAGELVVKTVDRTEAVTLLKILDQYRSHFLKYPDSLIVRFLGLHSITLYGTEFYLVVMKNIFPPGRRLQERYDIKGSYIARHAGAGRPGSIATCRHCGAVFILGSQLGDSSGYSTHTGRTSNSGGRSSSSARHGSSRGQSYQRHSSRGSRSGDGLEEGIRLGGMACPEMAGGHEPSITLKDNDLTSKIRLHPEDALQVIETLFNDSDALAEMGLMDYSLLVGVQHVHYDLQGQQHHQQSDPTSPAFPSSSSSSYKGYAARVVIAPNQYYFGIIDILQTWDYKKRCEQFVKVHLLGQPKDGISCIAPQEFRRRFQRKISSVIDHSSLIREVTGSWQGKR